MNVYVPHGWVYILRGEKINLPGECNPAGCNIWMLFEGIYEGLQVAEVAGSFKQPDDCDFEGWVDSLIEAEIKTQIRNHGCDEATLRARVRRLDFSGSPAEPPFCEVLDNLCRRDATGKGKDKPPRRFLRGEKVTGFEIKLDNNVIYRTCRFDSAPMDGWVTDGVRCPWCDELDPPCGPANIVTPTPVVLQKASLVRIGDGGHKPSVRIGPRSTPTTRFVIIPSTSTEIPPLVVPTQAAPAPPTRNVRHIGPFTSNDHVVCYDCWVDSDHNGSYENDWYDGAGMWLTGFGGYGDHVIIREDETGRYNPSPIMQQ